MATIPQALQQFRIKYGFWPKRELARVYWELGMRKSDPMVRMICFSHAMRLWPEIINCR